MSALRTIDGGRLPALFERHRRLIAVLAAVLGVALWADLWVRVVYPSLQQGHFPTSSYWVAPRLILSGREPILWDATAFADAAVGLGAFRDLGFAPNAPLTALPLLPFGLLPEGPAYLLWTTLSLACLVCVPALLVALRSTPTSLLVVVALLPLFHPLRSNLANGQAYSFVLAALVLSVVADRSSPRAQAVVGAALAGASILKPYYGLLVSLPLMLTRRWRAVVAAAVLLGSTVGLTVVLWGVGGWTAWLEAVLSWRTRPETSVTAYQTLNSLFGHLLRYDPTWNAGPVADLPALADVLWLSAAAMLLGVSALAIIRGRSRDEHQAERDAARPSAASILPMALFVPVAPLLSPIAEDYHYLLTLLPLLVAGAVGYADRHRVGLGLWVALAASLVLLAAPWPFNVARVDGWSALIFYPRVYGALLLWLVMLGLIWRRQDGRSSAT